MRTQNRRGRVPRISVNKLGEYLVTRSPSRRQRIIANQYAPPDCILPLYHMATDPIAGCLESGVMDTAPIEQVISDLGFCRFDTSWRAADSKNTAEALARVKELLKDLPQARYERSTNRAPKLLVNGVQISVRPDFLVFTTRRGVSCVGAVKFHYVKTNALDVIGCEYVATMLHEWLKRYGPRNLKPVHSLCFSIDVFRGLVVKGPASHIQRMKDVGAACREVAVGWPSSGAVSA